MRARLRCESCGASAKVRLADRSLWCWSCHAAALEAGYDDDTGTPVHRRAA